MAGDLVLLRCARLWDGLADAALENAAVLIDGGRIAAVGPASEVRAPEGASVEIWDYPDACVLPGLVDVHTHFTLPADSRSYEDMMRDADALMALAAARNLELHLRSGVTTARDNGARGGLAWALREGLRRGYLRGPRVLFAGRSITCSGGHFHFMGAVADGTEAIRAAIRLLVHEGADFIKLMASGGGSAGTLPGRASYSLFELRAAVEEAHGFGRLTVAHCRAKEAMTNAAKAGVDLIEHAQFLDPDLVPRFDAEVADSLLRAGTYISPTLQAGTKYGAWLRLRRQAERQSLSEAESARLALAEQRREQFLEVFQLLLRAGFAERLVAGSDSGCFDMTFGHLLYDLELMVAGGMSNRQALQAATSRAARAIGLEGQTGALRPGLAADLLVVAGDPLIQIGDLADVVAVVQNGRRVASEDGIADPTPRPAPALHPTR
ncbi:MAG: amidohydrolase family protein [Chloroflexota bacterium]